MGKTGPWRIDTKPFTLPDREKIMVAAHHIGYTPSGNIRIVTEWPMFSFAL